MPARSAHPIPPALLRKRDKWLKAIEAADIKAAVKVGGCKPQGLISPVFTVTAIDEQIEQLCDGMRNGRKKGGSESEDPSVRWFTEVCLQSSPDVPFFFASAAEVLLRKGNLEGLKEVLSDWASPRQRYLRGIGDNSYDIGWISTFYLPFDARLRSGFENIPLVTLAAIRGDKAAMQLMVQSGFCPTDWRWSDEGDALLNLERDMKALYPAAPKALKQYGMARGGLKAAAKRLYHMHDLDQKLEDAFEPETYKSGGRKKAFSLLKKGAPVGYYALAVATEQGDLEMLEALFAGGGNPNCVYKNGVPMLAKLSKAPLDAVRVWLKQGACPLMYHDPAEPDFGDGWRPSPLYEAVWEGNLELTRLMLEEAVIRPVIAYQEGKKFENPMADLARERGHTKLTAYLKEYAASMKV